MGPPKRKARKTPYSEIKRRYNYFEYRWDARSGSYYLFNPWTGETIFSISLDVLNRQQSMWAKSEKYPSTEARTLQLHPDFYLSRQWGRRKIQGFVSTQEAAVVITAAARGFLARLRLRAYFRGRYYTMIDKFSGYLYFVDRENPNDETRWFKPRLAFPDDIQEFVTDNPGDYMKEQRFSRQDFKFGPFIKVAGLNKGEKDRADLQVFHIRNELRDTAARNYADLDLEQLSIGDIVVWMDGSKLTELRLHEYHYMRAAIAGRDWAKLIQFMRQFPKNATVQLFGFHGFATTAVPLEAPGIIDHVSAVCACYRDCI
jgi:hypothetical protein